MKRILFAVMLLIGFIGVKAQDEMAMMMQPLPLNPNVKHGTLPNGLNYYILHNEEPKNRANFYIAQRVGSSLETPEQLGLAHFLEHMAFNGSEHYPGKAMLEYLQSKGIRFGADINAYTGFDETVYNINNVNTQDQALMDSCLLVLFDWSGSLLLEGDEIDAERGVIEGEYISRNDASTRMYTAILPQLYEEYQYEQMPIGKMEIVKNFPYDALRDYYKKWYRPDLQGIVIVGDFDADAMEKKVVELFSKIPSPENAAERIYPTISDNEKPIYVTFNDPELSAPVIRVNFKFDRTPLEMRNTLIGFMQDGLMADMVATMINTRLNEYSQKADCPFTYAGVNIGTYWVSNQKGSFNITIVPKDDIESAFKGAMTMVAQACKAGFMGTEVERARDEILSGLEKLYNEKDKTNSEGLGRELIRHFIDNEPSMGIEAEYQMAQALLMQLPEEAYNELCSMLIHPDNQVIVVTQPTTPDLNVPQENAMFNAMSQVLDAEYTPYVDEVITEPLIAKMPKAGKIKSEANNAEMGTKEYLLSNGVRVVVKPTDFSNDEIIITAFKDGGKRSYPNSEAANVAGLDMILDMAKIGPFNNVRLQKYLAGKKVGIDYSLGNANTLLTGKSTKKDLQTLFELYYAAFTNVSADPEAFEVNMSQAKTFLANQESNPMFIFQQKMQETLYPNNQIARPLTISTLDAINYNKVLQLYKESVKNAADYTFLIVGNVDESTIKPLITQYIASLPSKNKKTAATILTPFDMQNGQVMQEFTIKAESPAVYVFDNIHQSGLNFNVKNSVMIDLLGDIVDNVFTATLREEMGGTYSPQCWSDFSPYNDVWSVNWFVVTNAEQQQAIRDRAMVEFNKVLANGASAEQFNKVKEAALKQYENNVRTNNYWNNSLLLLERGFNTITDHRAAIESLTLDEFNKFIKTLYNGKNRIEVVGDAK